MSEEQALQVVDQALQTVKQGNISECEYAYQKARQQLQEAHELMCKAVEAVNTTRPALVKAWFDEHYPELHVSVFNEPADGPGYHMGFTVLSETTPHVQWTVIGKELKRYLDLIAKPLDTVTWTFSFPDGGIGGAL